MRKRDRERIEKKVKAVENELQNVVAEIFDLEAAQYENTDRLTEAQNDLRDLEAKISDLDERDAEIEIDIWNLYDRREALDEQLADLEDTLAEEEDATI
jgi:chromosome segregation ATPase